MARRDAAQTRLSFTTSRVSFPVIRFPPSRLHLWFPSLGWLAALALTGFLSGCASVGPSSAPESRADEAASCADYLDALDAAAANTGVTDVQAARVEGYPYLRVDRFLASFPPGTLDAKQFSEWLDRLQALDDEGRQVETANLPPSSRKQLAARFALGGDDAKSLSSRAAHCGRVLRGKLIDSVDLRYDLWTRAKVPDDYLDWERVLGLYPVAQIPFVFGVEGWQKTTLREFAVPLDAIPAKGEPVRYVPPAAPILSPAATAEQMKRWRDAHSLGIPEPTQIDLDGLLRAYAPVFVVDTASGDDRIGAIALNNSGESRVATDDPVAYAYPSYMRWHDTVLLQLNYVIWFPARPRTGTFDMLGGHLDGITWRLTLAQDGSVLVADSVHNCGCYHLFFPSAGLRPVAYGASAEERPFVPQILPALGANERYALRIQSGTHYVQRIVAMRDVDGTAYRVSSYEALRSLALDDQVHRSLFNSDGIVPGTERGERYFFWPMGVPDPGAMRQRGHHATAFVGRRHFDDPWLIERSFVAVGQ